MTSSIKFRTSDNEIIDIDKDAIKCSGTIRAMLELGLVETIIPMTNFNSAVFKKIKEWLLLRQENMQGDKQGNSEWVKKFFEDFDNNMLMDLVMAAKHLDIAELWSAVFDQTVWMTNGRSPEQIRQKYPFITDLMDEICENSNQLK